MKIASCLIVGLPGAAGAIAKETVDEMSPGAVLAAPRTIDEALKCPEPDGLELLVVGSVDQASFTKARDALDSGGLPRWAVVVCGSPMPVERIEFISPDEFTPPLVKRVFQTALLHLSLARENARLRADLLTISQRITHDLRSSLGGILSTGDLLKDVLEDYDPASGELVRPLFDSIDGLSRLIGRVSMFTKTCANPMAKKPVEMGEVVWAAQQRLQNLITKRRATIIQANSWPAVEGVRGWLEAVWLNLIENALQHGKEGVRIELGWTEAEPGLRFWVSDDGNGVAPEKIGTLFQPFHLLHRADARRGIGLSLVQRLVELQGGRCGYEASASGGACFFFCLPAGASR